MGKLIRNGIEYGGGNGTDIFEVTQAEYDALVQAGTLVHNALYVISDAPNLNPTASDIEYSSGVTVKQAIDGFILNKKTVFSGTKYASNDTFQINNFSTDKIYIIEFWCFSSVAKGCHTFYGGIGTMQFAFFGDNTQFCRYRLSISGTGLVTILPESMNNGTNTAITTVYELVKKAN